MPKKSSPIALSRDGKLYVRVQSIMHPFCALIDNLTLTFFGKGKTAYLGIDEAIAWCRKESLCHSRERYEAMIEVMERAKAQEGVA